MSTIDDLNDLVAVEKCCFGHYDQLSKRSFRYFITRGQAELWVIGEPVIAYGLVLFHRGTSLARIYSLAVHPDYRGNRLSAGLIAELEQAALRHKALFIRLEVADDNETAIDLFRRTGYEPIRRLHKYFDDNHDGIRMEKRLRHTAHKPVNLPFYAQTTEFTCGPAALMMGMKYIDEGQPLSRIDELNIWREATTIYMTTGHGGASPYGLALAAHRRGFTVKLWLSATDAPFIDSVRNEEKKAVIELIHDDFSRRVKDSHIEIAPYPDRIDDFRRAIGEGMQVILLISTYRLNRKKEPHWIWLVHVDADYAYINDPDVDEDAWKSPIDSAYVPVPVKDFEQMMKYGRNRYRAAVLIGGGRK